MDTRHLIAVLAVAEHGSFTQAARVLFMSQSTLSRQVIYLERELGVVLFVRGARSVTLTASGHAFLPHARRVLDELRIATAELRGS